ncbi:16S rRNA (guanine(527)-N(7))-methyltransferase RsmG [Petrotoga sp. SL27]|uniref:16S rRNA (guanine(527)-N(7))-methyltransferase RsmG n=1 Tax=Petrotoga sp. SL27 TaxID=1445612 RepID=UPI00074B206C|nr:16S rRNA (guanine(527)-N(7))-methyltransferase RsmG [Petrotoga sp. SL27]KUK81009.1 MAG: Ribosomal RNA small subunit methyltransferase G [Petrotoga mobilis]
MKELDEKTEKINKYIDMLINYPVNLTAYGNEKDAYENLILDSIIPIELEDSFLNSKRIVDIGTGGGIPGLVWAIYFPEKEFYLVDSVSKKIQALKTFIKELKLTNVYLCCERAEDFAKTHREYFDFATCKALARSDIALEYLAPLVKVNSYISLFKGPSYFKNEMEYAKNVLKKLNISEFKEIEYEIGEDKKKRYMILFKKIGTTPQNFPRQVGIPKKFPLGETK